ncbi:hypothetical protein BCV70DRAFT_216504 [Testicularia cyperi]|uniref:Uncharacterized protein n=1 Tax=Testicularia cyperi TaxID=1882483 RepID=A0A317XTG6_9BASI|nr:hypothetical protein BCV70DRAFT_216504 [Testicularia cyperi]
MSVTSPGVSSLLGAFLEPNLLILISYLALNAYLTRRVLQIATNRYPGLMLSLFNHAGEESHLAAEANNRDDDRDRLNSQHKHDTPIADRLIRISAWAFSASSRRAKQLLALMALASLASTWYYMFAFLHHSYVSYLERCRLTSFPLPPLPPSFDLGQPETLVPAIHLRLLRISQWLASLSLFKEAWMEVVKDSTSWWWSSEICIITVATWALFLRHESKRLNIPNVWTCMAVGQLVAISFAFNLFSLAVIYRLDALDLTSARADKVISPPPHVIESMEMSRQDVASTSPSGDSTSEEQDTPMSSTLVISTSVKRVPMPQKSSSALESFGSLLAKIVSAEVGMPLFALAGLYSVLRHPDTFSKVMVMHVFPMLIVVYPMDPGRPRLGSSFSGHARQRSRADYDAFMQRIARHYSRKIKHMPSAFGPREQFLAFGVVSALLRFWLTLQCLGTLTATDTKAGLALLDRLLHLPRALVFETFFRHPAQSSISSDHVCVALSIALFMLIEAGLWMWKLASASPSAVRSLDRHGVGVDAGPSSSIRLDLHDRRALETQARSVVLLLLLLPLIGGSATLSFYLALRCTWIGHIHSAQQQRETVISAEIEAVQVHNEQGEPLLEVRETKVVQRGAPRGAQNLGHESASPSLEPESPWRSSADTAPLQQPSSSSGPSQQSPSSSGRLTRTTAARQRHSGSANEH